jgi:uncharacterized protein YuzE
MKIVYDASVDILEFYLTNKIKKLRFTSKELSPGVVADLDKHGNILKLEILDASDRYSKEELSRFSYERLPA